MLISEQEFDLIFKQGNCTECNKILERVVQSAVTETLRGLPSLINNLIVQLADVKKLSQDFYDRNKDFAQNKELVAKTIERVETENPTKSYEDILTQAEREIKAAIGTVNNKSSTPVIKPSLNEIDNLTNLLG